ncbi:MAG: helicase associated domain-containing protein, partial [Bacilli bacterium]
DKDWNKSLEEINSEKWEKTYEKVKKFYEENGRFPKRGEECGNWLNTQRQSVREGKLSEERMKKLEEIDKDWNKSKEEINSEKWEETYEKVKTFYEENGRLPKQTEECGGWLNKQRQSFKKGKLSDEKIKKLEEIDKNWREGRKKVISVVNEANFLDLNQSSSDKKTKR